MQELIIHSRITAKKAPENTIPRSRLTKRIHENINNNILFISSPAGYGKTTLVQEYLYGNPGKYAWFHVTEDIITFYSFASYLVHSLKSLVKDFGEPVTGVINSLQDTIQFSSNSQTIITSVIGTFINDFIRHFKEDIIIVLDDLHNAENREWLKPAIEALVDDFPENLHLIITSRNVPPFDTSKLKAKRNYFELTSKDLLFDIKETEQVVKDIYGFNYSQEDVKFISRFLNGWITGIHLMLQAFGNEFNKAKLEKERLPETLFNFFANDIFKKLSESTQYFLLNTALLEDFDKDICQDLLLIKNSSEIIKELVNKNIFIETTQVNIDNLKIISQHYNYHALFKQYLLSKLYEVKSGEEIRSLSIRLAEYYKFKKETEKAVGYYIFSEDYTNASDLIKKSFQSLFDAGRFEVIWKWFEQVPEEFIKNDGELMFNKGLIIKYYRGDRETSLAYFTKAIEQTPNITKPDIYYNCLMQKCECLTHLGRPEESVAVLRKALEDNTGDELRIKLLFFLADSYYRIGYERYDEIIRILNESLELSGRKGIKYITTEIHNLLGNVYQDRGDFIKALFYFELAERNEENVYKKFRTLTNIVFLYSYSGNFSVAYEYIQKAKDIFKKYNTLLFERYLIRAEASLRFECGDYEEAVRCYEKLAAIDEASNLKHYIFWYYLFIGECYYFLNENDKADRVYELALNYKTQDDEYEELEFRLHKAINNKKNSASPGTETVLLEALDYFENNYLIYSKVQIEFHLADLYFRNNKPGTCLKYLASSLNTSSEKKFISFLEQLFIEYRYLFDFAIKSGIRPEFVSSLLNNVLEKRNIGWLSEECKERNSLGYEKIFDITLLTFGGPEILVRGNRIPENKWVRKISKQVLIYLLVHRKSKFTKEKIIDIFFRDHSPESAENLYHQVITNIRNAACIGYNYNSSAGKIKKTEAFSKAKKVRKKAPEIETEIDPAPELILYEDKVLSINPEMLIKIDSTDFDGLYNKFKSAASDDNSKINFAEQAMDLFKGEFLPGNYDSWCEELRELYNNRVIEMCEILLRLLKKKNLTAKIIHYGRLLLSIDRLNETGNLYLIEALCETGKVSQAKNIYSNMLKSYREEFGEKPDKSIVSSIQKILERFD